MKLKQSNVISLAYIYEHDMHMKIHFDYTKWHNNGKSTATRSENLTKASIACWFMSNTRIIPTKLPRNNAGLNTNSRKKIHEESQITKNNRRSQSYQQTQENTDIERWSRKKSGFSSGSKRQPQKFPLSSVLSIRCEEE